MNGQAYYWGFGYWWIFPLVMMFFCFLFMRGCRRRWSWGTGSFWGPGESAMDILDKRFARGEIDQQEYEERKRTLESDIPNPEPGS
ncbi:MAG: SHOCT domain-containing protein [bacterium]|nr:MAG: SHOCT domain-containing protein [bacterium]